jgi:hypothetical protein
MITASNPSIGLIKLGFTPEVDFRLVQNDSSIFIEEWFSGSAQPTDAAIDAATIEAQAEYDSKQYQRDRAEAYPSTADQLDDIYHNGVDGWKATIKAVKDTYPKETI